MKSEHLCDFPRTYKQARVILAIGLLENLEDITEKLTGVVNRQTVYNVFVRLRGWGLVRMELEPSGYGTRCMWRKVANKRWRGLVARALRKVKEKQEI